MRPLKLVSAIVVLSCTQWLAAQTSSISKADVEKRVDSLLSKMTPEEKIQMIGGINTFYTQPIARLRIPSLEDVGRSSRCA
jgi:hypothetical protein